MDKNKNEFFISKEFIKERIVFISIILFSIPAYSIARFVVFKSAEPSCSNMYIVLGIPLACLLPGFLVALYIFIKWRKVRLSISEEGINLTSKTNGQTIRWNDVEKVSINILPDGKIDSIRVQRGVFKVSNILGFDKMEAISGQIKEKIEANLVTIKKLKFNYRSLYFAFILVISVFLIIELLQALPKQISDPFDTIFDPLLYLFMGLWMIFYKPLSRTIKAKGIRFLELFLGFAIIVFKLLLFIVPGN